MERVRGCGSDVFANVSKMSYFCIYVLQTNRSPAREHNAPSLEHLVPSPEQVVLNTTSLDLDPNLDPEGPDLPTNKYMDGQNWRPKAPRVTAVLQPITYNKNLDIK